MTLSEARKHLKRLFSAEAFNVAPHFREAGVLVLKALDAVDTPEIHDFVVAVQREAQHQRLRWDSEHDAGKTDADWFWLLGWLAGKAVHAKDDDKRLHHIITTAAACLNWHAARMGASAGMLGADEHYEQHALGSSPSDVTTFGTDAIERGCVLVDRSEPDVMSEHGSIKNVPLKTDPVVRCPLCSGLTILPNFMDAPGGPRCACGRPSVHESGECAFNHGMVPCPRDRKSVV